MNITKIVTYFNKNINNIKQYSDIINNRIHILSKIQYTTRGNISFKKYIDNNIFENKKDKLISIHYFNNKINQAMFLMQLKQLNQFYNKYYKVFDFDHNCRVVNIRYYCDLELLTEVTNDNELYKYIKYNLVT